MIAAVELMAAARWWLMIVLLGAVATPLLYSVLRPLHDRGYAFSKMAGLLLVSYLFWLLASLGFLTNSQGSVIVSLALLAAASLVLYRRGQALADDMSLVAWLRQNRRQVLLTELVFAIAFWLWIWVRAQNPAIINTEKPMEFAFLNAIGRADTFPPHDPWLSGFAISYYYFGYVMVGVLATLAAVSEPVAFNLALAWLFAGTAVGAFGLLFNLTRAWHSWRWAALLAIVAALAIPLAGNLEIGLEILHGNAIGGEGFWRWLDVRDLNQPPDAGVAPRYESSTWWWWRSSRVIHEYHLDGRPEEGLEPIVEHPSFSFVLGDLHPHVLALPYALFSLALALTWYRRGQELTAPQVIPHDIQSGSWRNLASTLWQRSPVLWTLSALLLGGLSFLNTWDVLIHLFLFTGSFALGAAVARGWQPGWLARAARFALLLAAPAFVAYLPFYIGFSSQAGPPYLLPMLMRPTRLAHYLVIFGMSLAPISILLLTIGREWRYWRRALLLVGALVAGLAVLWLLLGWIVASIPEGADRVEELAGQLAVALPPRSGDGVDLGWGVAAILRLAPTVVSIRVGNAALQLFLAVILVLTLAGVWHRVDRQASRADPGVATSVTDDRSRATGDLPFVLLLIATGVLLTLGTEFVYLRDNFGLRINTMFKFYYQTWILFGIASISAVAYLWRRARVQAWLATPLYLSLLTVGLLFPVLAVASRTAEYRGSGQAETRRPATLDGLIHLASSNPAEYEAITWLRQNSEGIPTLLEAVGGSYTGAARVAAATGLPAVLGWPGHESQWRGNSNPEPGQREADVRHIYLAPTMTDVAHLLDAYGVHYVYFGPLEADEYGARSRAKFDENLTPLLQNESVTIYAWESVP